MQSEQIRPGEYYAVRFRGEEINVKVVSRCPNAIKSWMCERDDKQIVVIPVESFLRQRTK